MTPQNFNIMNDVYNQSNNFFTYRMMDEDYYKQIKFANMVTWTSEKTNASDVDPWTNITLTNTLDLDGSKGTLTSLTTYIDTLLALQEKAVSQILFNSRVQMPAGDGIPIEISNGYKVDGFRFYSDQVGCQNKWSVCSTPMGVYFIDGLSKSIYRFNSNGLEDLSTSQGMRWWLLENNVTADWYPISKEGNGIRTFYDKLYKDVYFTIGPTGFNTSNTLNYSEILNSFISQFSYDGVGAMFNYKDKFYSEYSDNIWTMFEGKENLIFGNSYNVDFSFISNENPTITKIFDTVEFRVDDYNNNTISHVNPFESITASNEYQNSDIGKDFKYKFRLWRALIPRVGMQRIRNPWAKITLTKNKDKNSRLVLHDLTVKYTY
jgi:hypothetical protein